MVGNTTLNPTNASAQSRKESSPEKKKLVPRAATKKPPWRNGTNLRAVPAAALDGPPSDTSSPSPGTHPGSRNPSAASGLKSSTIPASAMRKKSSLPAGIRRVSVVPPQPDSQPRMSQGRRVTLAPSLAPPRQSIRTSVSHEPQKRLSIVPIHNEDVENSVFGEVRPRAESLAPVPNHLERSDTPDSIRIPIQRDEEAVGTPAFVSRAPTSLAQPMPGQFPLSRGPTALAQSVPGAYPFSRARSRKMSKAVEKLEDMVQEAMVIAEDTKDREQVEEIYGIIEEARNAIQEASSNPTDPLLATQSPLRASSDDEEDAPDSLDDSGYGTHPRTPKMSVAVDFAFANPASSTEQLLPPQTAQTAPRDHVDFVLRPRARDSSRGRSLRRPTGAPSHPRGQRSESRRQSKQHSDHSEIDTSFDEEDRPVESFGGEFTAPGQTSPHTFSFRRHHRRQPIARNWSTGKKRLTAVIACINTTLLGIIIGVYAGEVPRIQYVLADEQHHVIIGNAVLYFGLALSTFIVWPLPLLHGRKPYVLAALALALPLVFPQAIIVSAKRSPDKVSFRAGLLSSRAALGFVLGFANVNYITVLLDLFGASLQSQNPHQELVVVNDVRRHGGGMGIWLGIWSWCWIGSLSVGFLLGAVIIEHLTPDWGFYIVILILASALVLNIVAPETRRAAYRSSVTEVFDRDENYITRRVARGEVKLHISTEGPTYWFEEVWAGIHLTAMMLSQPGFLVLALYLAWLYAQVVLVITLLGALLSRDYRWQPRWVGAGVSSIAIGSLLATPLTKAGIFSRSRTRSGRTDSMTFQKRITWSSHLVRRVLFTLTLPLMGLAYTLSAAGRPKPCLVPIAFAGAVGFFSTLALAECHGLIMETFDTCDLQPGVNTTHRLASMAVQDRRRRTNYSSFPRVSAGIFASQTLAFAAAGIATLVGGNMSRNLGAQTSTAVTAAVLLSLSVGLTVVLWRFKDVQVIPNHTFGTRRDTVAWREFGQAEKEGRGRDWQAVVIGNPTGKMRRMSALELGRLSRWTEIRRLNFLIRGGGFGGGKAEERKRGF